MSASELAIAAQIRNSLGVVESVLIDDSTADVTAPCTVQATITIERSAYDLDKTVIRLSLSTTVKHPSTPS